MAGDEPQDAGGDGRQEGQAVGGGQAQGVKQPKDCMKEYKDCYLFLFVLLMKFPESVVFGRSAGETVNQSLTRHCGLFNMSSRL